MNTKELRCCLINKDYALEKMMEVPDLRWYYHQWQWENLHQKKLKDRCITLDKSKNCMTVQQIIMCNRDLRERGKNLLSYMVKTKSNGFVFFPFILNYVAQTADRLFDCQSNDPCRAVVVPSQSGYFSDLLSTLQW